MEKDAIRKAMRQRRREVASAERAAASRAVCARLLGHPAIRVAFAQKAPIAVYLASPDEIDLSDFIAEALVRKSALVAPRWNGTTYELAPLDVSAGLVAGPHGIREPAATEAAVPADAVSVWLVPGLAFTATGKRLGYGGGWYDRLLSAASPSAMKLGVAYGFQLADDLPSEPHDRALDEIVSAP